MDDTTPSWIKKAHTTALTKLGHLYNAMLSKQNMIQDLEQHQQAQTAPKGLQITKQVHVNQVYQANMDALISTALNTFYSTFIGGLIEARKNERQDIYEEMTTTNLVVVISS